MSAKCLYLKQLRYGGKLKIIAPLLIFLVFNPVKGFAQAAAAPLDIVINEIAWMGTDVSANDEWIELYNNTENPINFDGWQLVSQDRTPKINLSGIIPANGFYLLERTDNTSVPNVPADQIYTGALGNTGETLELYDNFGNLIDRVDNSFDWSAGDNKTKQTMERIAPGEWQTSQNPGGTPKEKNSIVVGTSQSEPAIETPAKDNPPQPQQVQTIYPTNIVINEILPSPVGPDETEEWIEIFNQNDFDVDLIDWQIGDIVGKTAAYTFPKGTKISSKGFLVLSRPETKITLNNDGDSLNLLRPDGKIIDTLTYEKAPLGQSYNREGGTKGGCFWSPVLTPGAQNETPAPLSGTKTVAEKERNEESAIKDIFKKEGEPEKGMAAISEQISQEGYNFFFILLIALAAAIFSGVIILFLKRRIKMFDLKIKIE